MKIRTRKRTAAEKAADKAKKEEKKDLRQDKKEVKKDARQDKKEIRQDTREKKKDIRKSDLKGKDKSDAKKDVRQDKRKDIKDIKAGKKEDVKDIKEEIKEVRKSLEIILPVKTANVALLRNDLADINFLDNSGTVRHIEIEDAFDILNRTYQRSIVMAEGGLAYLRPFVVLAQRPSWIQNWNGDRLLARWFGRISKVGDATDVFNKLNSVVERLNKKMTIRLHPQRDRAVGGVGGTLAQNNGTFFEPRTFKVFPFLFEASRTANNALIIDDMASTFIHEMVHLTVFDQKLEGETVYGERLALQLAIDKPNRARKSPENFSLFCLELA